MLLEKKKYIIWGAGRIGEAAYTYYKGQINIICYVDNDERKWGSALNGLNICSPDILRDNEIEVIIALKNGLDEVKLRLETEFGIKDYTVFGFYQERHTDEIYAPKEKMLERDSVVICISDGLGNQMFQYALYRNLQNRGRNVYVDISSFNMPGPNSFMLDKVFPNIAMNRCTIQQRDEHISSYLGDMRNLRNFQIYVEPEPREEKVKAKNENLFWIKNGIIRGYHQCCQYADEIRYILLKDFTFKEEKEEALRDIAKKIEETNSVSIHIRRGDYLSRQGEITYGNICTLAYYQQAINYIESSIEGAYFYIFSNDITWAKENMRLKNAVYVDSSMFIGYEDWYDMYLMSLCKNNIIANSTFSWWGAWLNQNKEKMVIAPTKWINGCDYRDICPKEWIRL